MRKLVRYIKKNLKKGYTLDSLKWALINQGYSRTAVKRAIKKANKELANDAPKIKEKPKIKVKREPILEEMDEPTWKDKIRNFFINLKEIIMS
jgi:predicted DNA-binding protein YlxM (UPF0122 family)